MSTQRIFTMVPNVAFRRVVQQYCFSIGRPVLTMTQEQVGLFNYIQIAKHLN